MFKDQQGEDYGDAKMSREYWEAEFNVGPWPERGGDAHGEVDIDDRFDGVTAAIDMMEDALGRRLPRTFEEIFGITEKEGIKSLSRLSGVFEAAERL
jgi:hypothetical protein